MMITFIRAWWKPLLVLALVAAIAIGASVAWVNHGEAQYAAGYAKAQADQKKADDEAMAKREQEKTEIEREAQSRIDAARADAELANSTAGSLRAEIDKTRRLAEHYTGAFPTGTPASKVISVLADMLEESNRAYVSTAEEAERYRDAGSTCERQYDSLTRRGTSSR
nr:DUF2514 family protein [Cronobacter sakazakii]